MRVDPAPRRVLMDRRARELASSIAQTHGIQTTNGIAGRRPGGAGAGPMLRAAAGARLGSGPPAPGSHPTGPRPTTPPVVTTTEQTAPPAARTTEHAGTGSQTPPTGGTETNPAAAKSGGENKRQEEI